MAALLARAELGPVDWLELFLALGPVAFAAAVLVAEEESAKGVWLE